MGLFGPPKHIDRVIDDKPTEEKSLDVSQIYTLLDNRARDYRTILLGLLAGMIALTIAAGNASVPCMDPKFVRFSDCPSWRVPTLYLSIGIALALLAIFKIGREVRMVKKRAEYVRRKFIYNADDVPNIDGLLPRTTKVYDYDEVERKKRRKDQEENNNANKD